MEFALSPSLSIDKSDVSCACALEDERPAGRALRALQIHHATHTDLLGGSRSKRSFRYCLALQFYSEGRNTKIQSSPFIPTPDRRHSLFESEDNPDSLAEGRDLRPTGRICTFAKLPQMTRSLFPEGTFDKVTSEERKRNWELNTDARQKHKEKPKVKTI